MAAWCEAFGWEAGASVPSAARSFFEENGYVVFRGFASPEDTHALRAAADAIVRNPDHAPPQSAVFTTVDQARAMDDRHFLESASKVSCFREAKADQLPSSMDATEKMARSINKIGHALHDLHPTFASFSYSDDVRVVAESLGWKDPMVVQSMYIFKQPFIGGEVRPHRDASFILSEPSTCLGYWWALEDSTKQNGCLWAVPGSHKDGISKRFMLNNTRTGTIFDGEEKCEYDTDVYVPLPMRAGDLVVLHGALMHMSLDNTSEKSRHAFSIHLVDAPPASTYSTRSWLQRSEHLPFRSIRNPPSIVSGRN